MTKTTGLVLEDRLYTSKLRKISNEQGNAKHDISATPCQITASSE